MASIINAQTCSYCYLDLDFDNTRNKLATAAAFVDATDARYGFSSKDLRHLGGSELARIPELIATDHEWATKHSECGGIQVRPPPSGNRMVVKLFWDIAPMACENFSTLCANGGSSLSDVNMTSGKTAKPRPAPIGESGKPLTYRGSTIHRVIPGFVLQGGDFVFGNGSGGESIFNGKKFKDERPGLNLKHDRKGILSMGNSGKNSNSSQFFLTFTNTPQCDGKHVVFGELISGWEVLEYAETFGTPSSAGGSPTVPIYITECGIYTPLCTPACGYWYDQPDADSYSGISPVFMVRPRVAVVAPTTLVVDKFRKALGNCVSFQGFIPKENENEVEEKKVAGMVSGCLKAFAVDVVLVAPACKRIKTYVDFPKSGPWIDLLGSDNHIDLVIMEVKPVDALTTVWQKSWLAKDKKRPNWQLDGFL